MSAIRMWVIYDKPLDFPNHFVVRVFEVTDSGSRPQLACFVTDTLEHARTFVPPGASKLARDPSDDAVIVESWI